VSNKLAYRLPSAAHAFFERVLMTNQARLLTVVASLTGVLAVAAGSSSFATANTTPSTVKVVAEEKAGDAANGKKLYAANCAACHGATGTEGGVGPSLKGEKSKKNQAAAVAWIKNPKPPMPKLYPSPLSEKDVNDVAAYVETL
jgi:mono/diheme cytochrome c family protein